MYKIYYMPSIYYRLEEGVKVTRSSDIPEKT